MNDAKHTPGPWVIADNPYEVWTSKGPGYGLVAHCAPYCPPSLSSEQGREFAANARLIAAAPDLLEALRNLIETARAFGGYHTSAYLNRDAYLHKSWEAMMESIARGRELVAKAEGK